MKVLILGNKGLLGSDLMKVFAEYEPVGVDKDELDILSDIAVMNMLDEVKPEVVINATGYTAVDTAESKEGFEQAMRINGLAVGFLAEACEKRGITFVHFSTDYVFDGRKKTDYRETDVPNPINRYGESKFLGEQLLQQHAKNFYLIRTSWLFGKHGRNFVTTMLGLAKKGEPLKVVNDQIGKPTWAMDLAESVQTLLIEARPFGVYHIVNEEPVSWYDYALEIFEAAGVVADVRPIGSEEARRLARRPRNSVLANTKFPPLRSHKEALQNYLSTL